MYVDALPSETELIADLGCSGYALRGALQMLVTEGVVERVRGSGTYVAAHRRASPFERLSGSREHRPPGSAEATHELLEYRVVPASEPVADALELQIGEPVVFLERLARLDGEPYCLLAHWLPGDLAGELALLDLEGDYYDLLEQGLGLRVDRAHAVVDAVRADRGASALLEVDLGAVLLFMQTISRLSNGRPVDIVLSRIRPDRMVLTSTSFRRSHRLEDRNHR